MAQKCFFWINNSKIQNKIYCRYAGGNKNKLKFCCTDIEHNFAIIDVGQYKLPVCLSHKLTIDKKHKKGKKLRFFTVTN